MLLPQLVVPEDHMDNMLNNSTISRPPAAARSNLIGAPDQEHLRMNMEIGSWISSIHSAATPIGSMLSAPFMDRFGRKTSMIVSIVPLGLSWVIMALAHSHWMLILGRILGGITPGFMAAPAQIYIAEIAQPHLRGALIGLPFVAYSFGILAVYVLGWMLSWRWVAWASILFPILSWCALMFANDTPVWLVRNNRRDEAYQSMRWLRDNDRQAKEEVNELVERFEEEKHEGNDQGLWTLLKQRGVYKPILLVCMFNIFQILSGTFTVVFYAVQIVKEFTENSSIDGTTAAVFSAVIRFIITLIYCFILMVVKRRKMINLGGTVSTVSSLLLGFLVIFKSEFSSSLLMAMAGLLLILYLARSMCLFVMCGVSIGELLPANVRGRVSGYIYAAMNIILFGTVKIFPSFVSCVGISGLFFSFSFGSIAATLIMYLMMPETKDRKLTDIEDYFKAKSWFWQGG